MARSRIAAVQKAQPDAQPLRSEKAAAMAQISAGAAVSATSRPNTVMPNSRRHESYHNSPRPRIIRPARARSPPALGLQGPMANRCSAGIYAVLVQNGAFGICLLRLPCGADLNVESRAPHRRAAIPATGNKRGGRMRLTNQDNLAMRCS